jgi:ABC-type lipoprotein export system ATPase subunit
MDIILSAKGISKTYTAGQVKINALNRCDIEVRKGGFTAIVGKSGSGKSTLLRILGTMDKPDEGKVYIAGKDISNLKNSELAKFRRTHIGFIYQDYKLIPEYTAYENIILPLILDSEEDDEEEVTELMESLGIDYCKDKFPAQMSGGEQQRVAIARALITHPSVIFADEPTGNLDAASAETVAQMLTLAASKYQQTIVMVTHDRQMAEYADRILTITDGNVTGGGWCMNSELIALTFKGLCRRWREVVRVVAVVMISFMFVTRVLLYSGNMKKWQTAINKQHFGNWFVMFYNSTNKSENDVIKNHPYLEQAVTAVTVRSIEPLSVDSDNTIEAISATDKIMVGTMSDEFIKMGSITMEQGHMPEMDNEVAADRNTLIELGQGMNIGDILTIDDTTYTICGIINSYTNVWQSGNRLPGVIVTDTQADVIADEITYIYAYRLRDFISETDYNTMYQCIASESGIRNNIAYNSGVYDYQSWDNERVNRYMYMLIMIIGIVAVTYQIIIYNRSRNNVRFIQKTLGATSAQTIIITFLENVVILGISAIAGSCIALGAGKVICLVLEHTKGVTFFRIDKDIYIKVIIMMVISVVVSIISILLSGCHKKKQGSNRTVKITGNLMKKNFIINTATRLMRTNGIIVNILVRVFSFVMAVITVLCGIGIVTSYGNYKEQCSTPDCVNYMVDNVSTVPCIYYDSLHELIKIENGIRYTENSRVIPGCNEFNIADGHSARAYYFSGFKSGKSGIYNSANDDIINNLKQIEGIDDIFYGYYETTRSFTWDNMNINITTNGVGSETEGGSSENRKYMFAGEYVDIDKEIFDILNECAGGKLDYNALKEGTQSVVFLNADNNGEYDDTMKDGVTLNLNNYYMGNPFYNIKSFYMDKYTVACNKFFTDLISEYRYTIDSKDMYEYISDNISREQIIEIVDEYLRHTYDDPTDYYNMYLNTDDFDQDYYEYRKANYDLYMAYKRGEVSKEELFENLSCKGEVLGSWYSKYTYYSLLEPAASTNVAKVIILTDEIRDKLKYYVPEFGQYTIIGSTQLLQKALDNQNNVMKKYLFLDELPDYVTLKLRPNQFNIRYNLKSSFAATDNVVRSYLKTAGFDTISYSEEKNLLRQRTIESLMSYGVTAFAAIIIYMIVSMIIVKNRLEKYRSRLKLLSDTGAEKEQLVKICMYECIRESLWFIVLMPLELLICLVIVKKFVNRI